MLWNNNNSYKLLIRVKKWYWKNSRGTDAIWIMIRYDHEDLFENEIVGRIRYRHTKNIQSVFCMDRGK